MEIKIEVMNDHFTKYHLPDGFVLHKFTAADGPDADFHDHPWDFMTTILRGGYREEVLNLRTGNIRRRQRHLGYSHWVEAGTVHRITHLADDECWTIIQPQEWKRHVSFYRVTDNGIERRDARPGSTWERLGQ